MCVHTCWCISYFVLNGFCPKFERISKSLLKRFENDFEIKGKMENPFLLCSGREAHPSLFLARSAAGLLKPSATAGAGFPFFLGRRPARSLAPSLLSESLTPRPPRVSGLLFLEPSSNQTLPTPIRTASAQFGVAPCRATLI